MKYTLKRIGAYILDMFLVVLVANLISSLTFINKDYKKYNEMYAEYESKYDNYQDFIGDMDDYYDDSKISDEEYNNILEDYPKFSIYIKDYYGDTEIEEDVYKKVLENVSKVYEEEVIDYNYKLSKLNIISSVITIICVLIYFVIVQYLLGGQTLGKRMLGLRIVNKDNTKTSTLRLLIRTIILSGIIITIGQIICLCALSPKNYYFSGYYMQMISSLIEFSIILTVVLRNDNRGLHDLIAGTKVIELNGNDQVIEAQCIESK